MKNKRGMSAIEMIISFLLFVGFLVFIFSYLNPLKNPTSFSNTEALYSEMENALSIEINYVGLNVEGYEKCFIVENPFNSKVFALDENRNKINVVIKGNDLLIEGGKNFYYIYDNADVSSSTIMEQCKTPEKYSWSVKSKEKVMSFEKMKKLNESYYKDYNSLKNLLKIPSGKNFAIIIYDNSRNNIFELNKKMPKTEIVSLEYPIEILKENGIEKGAIRIIEW